MTKMNKVRPIAPQTKHPMRRLYHLTGRAWSFITANIPGDHFVLQKGSQVVPFLAAAQADLQKEGTICAVIKDIEGCFPNMPKPAIAVALTQILHEIKTTKGHDAVYVPTTNNKPCRWQTKAKGYKKIPFEVLLDVMNFSLHNTIITNRDGALFNQFKGIPMGDPHSPGMTIGTCAWMEKEWMDTIHSDTKKLFRAKRYMDDILLLYAAHDRFQHDKFLRDFERSDCYFPPLVLEEAKPDTFLETTFEIIDNKIRHWLKNENDPRQPPKIWRYSHFRSHMAFAVKRGVINATLKKVQLMASDRRALYHSAIQKLAEFFNLGYPRRMLWTACTTLGVQSREPTWFDIRDDM